MSEHLMANPPFLEELAMPKDHRFRSIITNADKAQVKIMEESLSRQGQELLFHLQPDQFGNLHYGNMILVLNPGVFNIEFDRGRLSPYYVKRFSVVIQVGPDAYAMIMPKEGVSPITTFLFCCWRLPIDLNSFEYLKSILDDIDNTRSREHTPRFADVLWYPAEHQSAVRNIDINPIHRLLPDGSLDIPQGTNLIPCLGQNHAPEIVHMKSLCPAIDQIAHTYITANGRSVIPVKSVTIPGSNQYYLVAGVSKSALWQGDQAISFPKEKLYIFYDLCLARAAQGVLTDGICVAFINGRRDIQSVNWSQYGGRKAILMTTVRPNESLADQMKLTEELHHQVKQYFTDISFNIFNSHEVRR